MRIALLHNLPPGGARRTVAAQLEHLGGDVVEICLSSATPVTDDARVVGFRPLAPSTHPALRPLLRHTDLAALVAAWWRASRHVAAVGADVVFAHPCQYLQAPSALLFTSRPSVYFCHEPRRIDYEPALRHTRRGATRIPYAPLHAAERALDWRGVAVATRLVTNSRYSAGRVRSAYGRDALPVPLGVGANFTPGDAPESGHVLTVGTLIPGKGHEVVIRAAALAAARPRVVLVAPRPDDGEHARLAVIAEQAGVSLDVRTAISDAALRDLYRGALATVQMGVAEPLGLGSMEAQACGCPVVVAAEGGLPETLQEGVTGWAVARDPVAVAQRLDALADPALRARMARAASAWGATMTWKRSGDAVLEVLRETAR